MFTRRDSERIKRAAIVREMKMKMAWDYGGSLERSPAGMIRDVVLLPFTKNDLFEAMLYAIANARTRQIADLLSHAAITLAEYQEGIGREPLTPLGTAPDQFVPKLKRMRADSQLIEFWTKRAKKANPYIVSWWGRLLQRWNISGPMVPQCGYVDFGYEYETGSDAF